MMHTEETVYRLLPDGNVIEAVRPLYVEAVESDDWRDPIGTHTQPVIGQEVDRLAFRLSADGALALDSASADLPGWHHVAQLGPKATPADVLEWVKGREFIGRQFWQPAP